jgi:hypothetical protein
VDGSGSVQNGWRLPSRPRYTIGMIFFDRGCARSGQLRIQPPFPCESFDAFVKPSAILDEGEATFHRSDTVFTSYSPNRPMPPREAVSGFTAPDRRRFALGLLMTIANGRCGRRGTAAAWPCTARAVLLVSGWAGLSNAR